MAQLQKKKRLANEYEVICFAIVSSKSSAASRAETIAPVFIRVLRRTLAKLGGVKKFKQLPVTAAFTTNKGLSTKYSVEDGVVFRTLFGTLSGVKYDSKTIVAPPLGKNKLTLTLDKVRKTGGKEVREKYETVSIGLPSILNAQDVATWINSTFGKSGVVIAWKYGDVREVLDDSKFDKKKSESKASRGGRSGGKGKASIKVPMFMPIGTIKNRTPITLKSGVAGSKKENSVSTVFAVVNQTAARLLGYSKPRVSTDKDIESGTKLAERADKTRGDKSSAYSVFAKTALYSQVWQASDSLSNNRVSAISNPGIGMTVKARYSVRSSVGTAVRTASQHAVFYVPVGTPVGMIAEFLLNVESRPRSFQVATGGGNKFGKSYPLPQRDRRRANQNSD